MKGRRLTILLSSLLILSAAPRAAAQDERPSRRELVEGSFDPESFHHTARFLLTTGTGAVILDPACEFGPDEPLGPDDRCVVLAPAPALTLFDEPDVGRITLPGNSTKNLVLPFGTHTFNYQFLNVTGVRQGNADFQYTPYITVESEALKDPRAKHPVTGVPYDGKIEVGLGGGRRVNRSLAADERIRESLNYTRAGIGGISKSLLMANFGLPEDVVDRMFRQPMTFRLGIRGRARHVSDAFMFYGLRLMGN